MGAPPVNKHKNILKSHKNKQKTIFFNALSLYLNLHYPITTYIYFKLVLAINLQQLPAHTHTHTHTNTQLVIGSLLGLGAIGIVDDHTSRETCLHGLLRDELHLGGVFRVELKHGSCTSALESKHMIL